MNGKCTQLSFPVDLCPSWWLALWKPTLTRIRAPVMKCNKGGVTGKTEVAGTRTTQQRIVRRCVEQVDSLGLRPRDQKVAYTGRCVRWNVVWRFAACYHMWLLPTLVLVFIPLPHMCWPGFLSADFEQQLKMMLALCRCLNSWLEWWADQLHHVCGNSSQRLLLKVSWHYQWHSSKATSCW